MTLKRIVIALLLGFLLSLLLTSFYVVSFASFTFLRSRYAERRNVSGLQRPLAGLFVSLKKRLAYK